MAVLPLSPPVQLCWYLMLGFVLHLNAGALGLPETLWTDAGRRTLDSFVKGFGDQKV